MSRPPELIAGTRRRALLAGSLGALGSLTVPPGVAATDAALPSPSSSGGMALTQALAGRRSVRNFSPRMLSLATVSQLLWAAQGITGAGGRRTAPSAGALYPLEIHLVATRVDGLAAGLYRYRAARHDLQPSLDAPSAAALQAAALRQPAVGAAALVVVITAVEERTAAKYGTRAARYVAFEAGAAAQNLALQAAALGLGGVVIGGFDDAGVGRALRLPADERPVVLVPIGAPA